MSSGTSGKERMECIKSVMLLMGITGGAAVRELFSRKEQNSHA